MLSHADGRIDIMKLPVYIINGFIESGKTEFIEYTLSQPYFEIEGETLLLLCEEGENEYEKDFLESNHTVMSSIEEEAFFDPAQLSKIEKDFAPERIVIEFNGMWDAKNVKLPENWEVQQQITMIEGIADLSAYKRNVKAINQSAEIIFEDAEGELSQIMEEELPYDLENPIINLDGKAYGIWYLDVLEQIERYIDKTVKFKAYVLKPSSFPEIVFVPGRMAMTCCADDMAFLGFACVYENAKALEPKEWIEVTATLKREYFAEYRGEGPVLYAKEIKKVQAPVDAVISFV